MQRIGKENGFVSTVSFRPFKLSRWLFRDDRLVSRPYAVLFAISSILVLAMIPLILGRLDPAKMSFWTRLPLGLLGVFGPLALFFLWIGMWTYWVRIDDSNRWAKR